MKSILRILSIIFFVSFTIILNSCNKSEEDGKEKEATEEGHEEAPKDQVTITPEQYEKIGIKLGAFEQKNLASTLKANGILELPPQNKASISSFVGGIVKNINVVQGDYVKKGQKLASIEHPDILQIQEDYLKAKSEFSFTEKEYFRQKQLYEEKVVAGKKFQQAEADYKAQKALLQSLENKLSQLGISPNAVSNGNMTRTITLTSPMNGYVNLITVSTGSSIAPATELFTIVDNSYIHVDLQIYEKDVTKVREGQKVQFALSNSPNEQFEAVIFKVNRALDNETKSTTVHAEIKGNTKKNLMPGMYVSGRIAVEDSTVNALPDDAIFSEGELKYIFIKTKAEHHDEKEEHHEGEEKETHKEEHKEKEEKHEHKEGEEHEEHEEGMAFKRIEVKTGVSDMGYTEIIPLSPIPANAEIVIKGAYYLAAQLKSTQGGGSGGDGHGH